MHKNDRAIFERLGCTGEQIGALNVSRVFATIRSTTDRHLFGPPMICPRSSAVRHQTSDLVVAVDKTRIFTMISSAPPKADEGTISAVMRTCSLKREQVAFPIEVVRMMGLDTTAGLLGKGRLADELCITVRNLNYKINGERGACDADIIAAARALEARAEGFLAHAQKLRAVVPSAVSRQANAKLSWQTDIAESECSCTRKRSGNPFDNAAFEVVS